MAAMRAEVTGCGVIATILPQSADPRRHHSQDDGLYQVSIHDLHHTVRLFEMRQMARRHFDKSSAKNFRRYNADDEGENDRSLTASDIKPDRSTGIHCQIECRLIQLVGSRHQAR
jgi:hypothetical protein